MKYIMHEQFDQNTQGRDFVVGDIHGCYTRLMNELEILNFDRSKDRLFSVGDLVDRGPENVECLTLLEEPWFWAVRGNHEDMMIKAIKNRRFGDVRLWQQNGGEWLWDTFDKDQVEEYIDKVLPWLENLPLAITVNTSKGRIGICHAEVPSHVTDWNKMDNLNEDDDYYTIQDMIWGRSNIKKGLETDTQNVLYTIHGHTPVKEATRFGNSVYIDTGAVYSYKYPEQFPEEMPLTIIQIDGFDR